jgi:ring-1,2-phenylacetyl-CoA epoxidase subunit PaaE
VTQFHSLTIKDVRRETPECVSIAFEIPDNVKEQFIFQAGQNITLRLMQDGEELRRSYSICSSPLDNELRVAVKQIPAGKFSAFANRNLKPGDKIEVLPPSGRFGTKADKTSAKKYLAFAAGSGITPVISIIKTVLATEPLSEFTLVYGNRDRNNIIFREQLEALKNKYMSRFAIHHVLSRETTDAPVNHGRINKEKCEQLSKALIDVTGTDHIFLCGPEEMIFNIKEWLVSKNVSPNKIHFELFTIPGQKSSTHKTTVETATDKTSKVTIKIDGAAFEFNHPFEGTSILDGALRQGADLPFACKGGVCATCKAKLVSGQVEMDTNYALEEEELQAGFILTCQSHPRTPEVIVDFDSR